MFIWNSACLSSSTTIVFDLSPLFCSVFLIRLISIPSFTFSVAGDKNSLVSRVIGLKDLILLVKFSLAIDTLYGLLSIRDAIIGEYIFLFLHQCIFQRSSS